MSKIILAMVFACSLGYVVWAILDDIKCEDKQDSCLHCERRK